MKTTGTGLYGLALAAVLAAAPTASAAAEAAARCRQADIGGEWLMMTNTDGTPSVCELTIGKNGLVTEGLCSTGSETAVLNGQIFVDAKCNVGGRYKIRTEAGVLTHEVSFGIMARDHSFFTMAGFERHSNALSTNFVQRKPQ